MSSTDVLEHYLDRRLYASFCVNELGIIFGRIRQSATRVIREGYFLVEPILIRFHHRGDALENRCRAHVQC
jgi:hypothetical protein